MATPVRHAGYTHTCTHAHAHTHTNACTCTCAAYVHTCIHACIHTHTYYIHVHTHSTALFTPWGTHSHHSIAEGRCTHGKNTLGTH